MEIAIAAFICLWLSFFAVWGYRRLKKEYEEARPEKHSNVKEAGK